MMLVGSLWHGVVQDSVEEVKLKQHERVELVSGVVRDVVDRDRQRQLA